MFDAGFSYGFSQCKHTCIQTWAADAQWLLAWFKTGPSYEALATMTTAEAGPPEDEVPRARPCLGVPVRCAERKSRTSLTAELLAVARSLIVRRPPCPSIDASALPPPPPALKARDHWILPPPSPPPKAAADACTRALIHAVVRRLALEARCFDGDAVSAWIATYAREHHFDGDRAWATCVGDVWYARPFVFDVVMRPAPAVGAARHAHACSKLPLPAVKEWTYFEVELAYEDQAECFVGAQPILDTRRGGACGKARGGFALATLGGLHAEGAFRRGGVERPCDRVGVLSRIEGNARRVVFLARRRGGAARRVVGAVSVSCGRDVFPTVTLRSRHVTARALLDAECLPSRRELEEACAGDLELKGAVYDVNGERLKE